MYQLTIQRMSVTLAITCVTFSSARLLKQLFPLLYQKLLLYTNDFFSLCKTYCVNKIKKKYQHFFPCCFNSLNNFQTEQNNESQLLIHNINKNKTYRTFLPLKLKNSILLWTNLFSHFFFFFIPSSKLFVKYFVAYLKEKITLLLNKYTCLSCLILHKINGKI